jgi:hypothetical protein
VAHLPTLWGPTLTPVRNVLAVRTAKSVGAFRSSNLAEHFCSTYDLLGAVLPLRPSAETAEDLLGMVNPHCCISLTLEVLQRPSLNKRIRLVPDVSATTEVDDARVASPPLPRVPVARRASR